MRCGLACAAVLPAVRVAAPAAVAPDRNLRREMPHRQPASCMECAAAAFAGSATNGLFCIVLFLPRFAAMLAQGGRRTRPSRTARPAAPAQAARRSRRPASSGSTTRDTSRTGTSSTATSETPGYSLAPISASVLSASARSRAARAAATFFWINPRSSAAARPPAASISWNSAQAARQSLSVRSSLQPAPAVGSATCAMPASSSRTSCALRATRRAKRSGRPRAAVNGSTVIASAPPTPAENTAMVARRMFT